MRIRKPAGISTTQLLIATVIGFGGGVYIWQPLLIKLKKEREPNLTLSDNSPATEPAKCMLFQNDLTRSLCLI